MEGFGFVDISPIVSDFEVVLYQPFGLLGQDRTQSDSLADISKAQKLIGYNPEFSVREGLKITWENFIK